MFKIGEFSGLTQVSVKTLRWYDELGLLKPARVDVSTGYRYYSARQISRLARILVLKNLGFSLEQVRVMLDGGIQAAQMREMLQARRQQLVGRLQQEQEKLNLVDVWLRKIENEGGDPMSRYDILIKNVEPVTVYSKRRIVPSEDRVLELLESVWNDIMAANIRKTGPSMTIYHQNEYKERDLDVEAAMPVPSGCGLETSQLPAIEKAACLVYYGSHEGLGAAYSALAGWIEDNGYGIEGFCRTLFLTCAETEEDPNKFVTEIQVPVNSRRNGFPCAESD